MAHPVRTYQVKNPSVLFDLDTEIVFASARPAGEIVTRTVGGRRVRVLLTDEPLNYGRFAAELQVTYL